MADYKPCRGKSWGMHWPFPVLLVGFLWMGVAWPGGHADGQPTKDQPAPPQIPVAEPVFLDPIPQAVQVLTRRITFNFTIKPDTPLKELLPTPPKANSQKGSFLIEDLSQVPEVAFQEPLAKTPEALKLTAHTMAKINHLNRKKPDGFVEALLGERADLAALPFAMGDACRMKGERSQFFSQALATIKAAKGQGMENVVFIRQSNKATFGGGGPPPTVELPQPVRSQPQAGPRDEAGGTPVDKFIRIKVQQEAALMESRMHNVDPDVFWDQFRVLCAQENKINRKLDQTQLEHVTLARIAALMQVLAPESVAMRKGLVQYLASISHAEATRALAKLAIFSAEDEVRNPAIEALKVRREKDYTEILLRGLRYPLPAVAKRATEAMVKLERADLVAELVNFLEEPDPRAPAFKEMGEKKVPVVRELVRINHHRNCLMCHSPAVANEVSPQVTTAEVPRPDQPLPLPSEGYSNAIPDVLVRLDVTYLRQDFSLMQPVADAHPWPEMQRFDFLVRNRVLTEQEATAFPAPKTGVLSPYQRVTLAALRELTGRDTAPTPDAWRKLLDMPGRAAKTLSE